MTLTDALRAALADPPDLELLRQIAAQSVDPDDTRAARQALLAHLSLAGLVRDHLRDRLPAMTPAIVFTLLAAGGNRGDLHTVTAEPAVAPEIPRSAEWVSAAERLAAWADGQVEPAPWDESTVMSDEDIADLVGL